MRGCLRNSGSTCNGFEQASNIGAQALVMEERYPGPEGRLINVLAVFRESRWVRSGQRDTDCYGV